MREPIRYLSEHASLPLSVIPNAGLPLNTGIGEAVYPLEPAPMAEALAEFVSDFGVRIVGGCCGTTPAHLEAVVTVVRAVEEKRGTVGPRNERGLELFGLRYPPLQRVALKALEAEPIGVASQIVGILGVALGAWALI